MKKIWISFCICFLLLAGCGKQPAVIPNNETTFAYQNSSVDKKDLVSQDCESPTIKGVMTENGEKNYHVPGGQYYDSAEENEVFCTEEYAKAAGYRKSEE